MVIRNPTDANDAAVSNRFPFDRNFSQPEHRRSSRRGHAIGAGAVARWECVR